MTKPAEVIQTHADHEENIERIVKLLGHNKIRSQIFCFIYGRGRKPKTVTDIVSALRAPRQGVLNQINYLAHHKLVTKVSVPAGGRGGVESAYGKIDFMMANKHEILRKQAKPELVKRTPTKRRQQVVLTIKGALRNQSRARMRSPSKTKLRVLYLTANPASQAALRTDAEVRMVQGEVRGSKYRDDIDLIARPAADAKSIMDGINDHRPQIVHFSGHGGGKSIWIDDGKVEDSVGKAMSLSLLAGVLGATDSPPTLLVLNACDTLKGARVLLKAVQVVIAMSDSISDIGAATFAAQFYAAMASGQSIPVAFKQGKLAMRTASLADAHLPELIYRKGKNLKKIVLVGKH